MARCFPCPPTGFPQMCSTDDALILSIKPERENEVANLARERAVLSLEKIKKKEKKRHKKKGRSSSAVRVEKQKFVQDIYQDDKHKTAPEGKYSSLLGVGSEVLEKSSITEEYGQPINPKIATCCSSDSTGNSSKRKRASSPGSSGIQSHGRIIRIRLSNYKKKDGPSTSGHKEQDVSLATPKRDDPSTSCCKVLPCSNTGRTQSSLEGKDALFSYQDNSLVASASNPPPLQLASVQDSKVPYLPEKKIEPAVVKKPKLSSHEKKMLKKESRYNNLFENWVPPPVFQNEHVVDNGDNEDWLFGKNNGEESLPKRMESSDINGSRNVLPSCSYAVKQPRALLLPEADVYALPFTVPF